MPDRDRPQARLALADTEGQEQRDAAAQLTDTVHDVLQRASPQLQLGCFHHYQGHYDDALKPFEAARAIYRMLKRPWPVPTPPLSH